MSSKINFTNNRLDKIEIPESGRIEVFDAQQHGLSLRVTAKGKKTFRLNVWDKNRKRPVRETVGEYPVVSIADARKVVAKRVVEIAEGIDTAERRRKAREEQTLNDIFDIWLEEYAKPNNKRWDQDERRYELYIKPHMGTKKLSEITPDLIRRWKVKLSKQRKQNNKEKFLSKGVIHRAQIVLSSIFGKAAPQISNPCSQVEKYKPQKRTTFMGGKHLKKFFDALDAPDTPRLLRSYLLLSLYTGARQSNVLAMRWDRLDLDLKLWIIPGEEMKNQENVVIPLSKKAVELLREIEKESSSEWVLPSPRKSKTGHLQEPKRGWKALLKRAGLPTDYRLHDLRRTLGSWEAITGTSTKMIGASLGNRSEQATAHYAHLTPEPIRDAVEKAIEAMENAAGIES